MKIKQELQEKYDNWIKINSEDDYSRAVVEALEKVGNLLDEGKTPKEALDALYGNDLTGYMAGVAVSVVVHFNPRGEELKPIWNKEQGGTGEEKGTINPAIITLNN